MTDKDLTISKGSRLAAAPERKIDSWLTPAVDICENDQELTVVADLPGVGKESLHLGIEQNVLTIEGYAPAAGEGKFFFREFGASGYHRRFQLPDNLELDKIKAEMKDGVLLVRLPKSAAARPRRIQVSVH